MCTGRTATAPECRFHINVGTIRVTQESTWSLIGKIEGLETANPKPTEVSYQLDEPFEETVTWNVHNALIQPDGTFSISGLAAGDYTLSANTPDRKDVGYASIHVADRSLSTTIHLGEAGRITGKVLAPGMQQLDLKDVKVSAEPINQQGFQISGIDSKNDFDIQNLAPGIYTIGVVQWNDSAERPYPQKITCAGMDYTHKTFPLSIGSLLTGCEIVLSRDTGSISGTVKNGDEPQPNLIVSIIPQARDLRVFRRYTLKTTTDAQGRYRIGSVIPGDYFVFAGKPDPQEPWFALNFADDHRTAARAVTVAAGQVQHADLAAF